MGQVSPQPTPYSAPINSSNAVVWTKPNRRKLIPMMSMPDISVR